jgi:fructoselysine-6-P-deglycase FrlB-like protein
MDELVFGRPAAQAVADLARRAGTDRIFLMACGTPNQETEEVVTAMTASRLRHA